MNKSCFSYQENYNKLNLHDLRVLGAQIGVKAPSTLKKEQLIKEIIAVERGEKSPHFSNRGRRRKDMFSFSPNISDNDVKDFDRKKKDLKNKVNKAIKILTEIYEILQDLT